MNADPRRVRLRDDDGLVEGWVKEWREKQDGKGDGRPFPASRSLIGREDGKALEVWTMPEPPPREFVIPGLIPEDDPTILYGDGGNLKSLTALGLADAKCAGGSFLGNRLEPGRVLYVDAELDDIEFRRRAYRIARGCGRDRPPDGLYYWRLPGSLASDAVRAALWTVASSIEGLGLTVLDSLSVASAGENIRTEEFVILLLQEIRRHLRTTLIIDHTPSTAPGANLSDYNPYGSVFKRNLARSVIQVVRAPAGGLLLRQKKSNFGPIAPPQGLKVEFLTEAGLDAIKIAPAGLDDACLEGIDDHMSALDRTERELARAGVCGITPAELAEKLDVKPKTVSNRLSVLKRQGRATGEGDGRWVHVPASPSLRETGKGNDCPAWCGVERLCDQCKPGAQG